MASANGGGRRVQVSRVWCRESACQLGCTLGKQDGDAVDDGVAAATAGAADAVSLEGERGAADGAGEQAEVSFVEGA